MEEWQTYHHGPGCIAFLSSYILKNGPILPWNRPREEEENAKGEEMNEGYTYRPMVCNPLPAAGTFVREN